MVKALFDTNILVDYLNAVPQARTELRRYEAKAVSIVTWMEVMVGATEDVEDTTRSFEHIRYHCARRGDCRARCQPAPQPSHQIARRNYLGNGKVHACFW